VVVKIKPSDHDEENRVVEKTSSSSMIISDDSIYSSPIQTVFTCDAVVDSSLDHFPSILSQLDHVENGHKLFIGYGHSGSGKTHTMFGDVLAYTVETVFSQKPSLVHVSFFEIYNEKILDLLGSPSVGIKSSRLTTTTTVSVSSPEELFSVVQIGLSRRCVSANRIHDRSSRSHAILTLTSAGGSSIQIVDLAGSERGTCSSSGRMELQNIHKSLHALRLCIMGLSRPSGGVRFLPTRSSILTRVLFAPNRPEPSSCILIACISPEKIWERETLSTIDFATAGLNVSSWWSPPPVRAKESRPNHVLRREQQKVKQPNTSSDTELLRYAIQKLKAELEIERARRRELEAKLSARVVTHRPILDITTSSEEASTAAMIPALVNVSEFSNNTSASCVSGTIGRNGKKFFTDESSILFVPSPKHCRPGPSPTPAGTVRSVMSQSWRHSQYDDILKRLWAESPNVAEEEYN